MMLFRVGLIAFVALVCGLAGPHRLSAAPALTSPCATPISVRWFSEQIQVDSSGLPEGIKVTVAPGFDQYDIITIENPTDRVVQVGAGRRITGGQVQLLEEGTWRRYRGTALTIDPLDGWIIGPPRGLPPLASPLADLNIRSGAGHGRRPANPTPPPSQRSSFPLAVDGQTISLPLTLSYRLSPAYFWKCDEEAAFYAQLYSSQALAGWTRPEAAARAWLWLIPGAALCVTAWALWRRVRED